MSVNVNQPQLIESVIVGLGTTGLSVAHFLAGQEQDFAVVDSRENPPNADDLLKAFPKVAYHFGDFNTPLLTQARQLIVNPGIAIDTAEIKQARLAGASVIGDIELFARQINDSRPIVAITGSNGKTTVTSLLDLMARKSGVNVGTGGNIGTPALDLLSDEDTELFILELSSYQLETSPSLHTLAAVILNVSEDHLDRYDNDIEKYALAKSAIYQHCQHIISNREDAYSQHFAELATTESVITFGMDVPQEGHYGVRLINGVEWLARGDELMMPTADIKLPGRHNIANALAALALGDVAGLNQDAMLEALREHEGMAHRTQWLTQLENVNWYNDSKGTNVGATLAALSGLTGKTVLIAGGQGKGADFLPLKKVISDKARAVVLMGEDADKIAQFVDDSIPVVFVDSMRAAVEQAYQLAEGNNQDNVLLSPACASFDMFDNYAVRGEVFMQEVALLESRVSGRKHND